MSSIHIKKLPEAEPPPDSVGEGQFMRRRRVFHRRQGIEIGLEVDEVLISHALIGCVRKRRIEVNSTRCDSALHRVDEVERAPISNAGLLVWRDIRHVEGAEWRLQATPPAQTLLVLGLWILAFPKRLGMALRAAADGEHVLAIGKVGRVRRKLRSRHRPRHGQQIEDDRSSHGQGEQRPPPCFAQLSSLNGSAHVGDHAVGVTVPASRDRFRDTPCTPWSFR